MAKEWKDSVDSFITEKFPSPYGLNSYTTSFKVNFSFKKLLYRKKYDIVPVSAISCQPPVVVSLKNLHLHWVL
jgi:hypothetical protein